MGMEIDDPRYVTAGAILFGDTFNFSLFKSLLLGLSEPSEKSFHKSSMK